MAVVSLPLTFQNSFWSQDYRKGLEVLYGQLEQGIAENEDIVAFIRARAAAEAAVANALATPAAGTAFETDDGASLAMAFRGLQEETLAQGKIHETISTDLRDKIAKPFAEWATGYKERLHTSKATIVDGYLGAYEIAQEEVSHLKNIYLAKTRKADEAEDDARFAPVVPSSADKLTSSPNLGPRDRRTPTRQPTMSERITARLKEFRLNATHPAAPNPDAKPAEVHFDAETEEKKIDKGKGRAVDVGVGSPQAMASPPPMSPALPPQAVSINTDVPPSSVNANAPLPPITIAGVEFKPAELSALLTRAKAELNLRSVRFPLLGEYQEAFTGEDLTNWLRDNVKGFEGDLDHAEDAAKELVEKHNLLRRLGEFGNDYEDSDEAWYQFRPKAFSLDAPKSKEAETVTSPIQKNLTPIAENVAKKTSSFATLVTKALTTNPNNEPPHIRARREADEADQQYRAAIRKLDRQRLGLEERIEDTLKALQKWELDRLRAVKTVLNQYQTCLEQLPKAMQPSLERSSTLIASYQPEADLRALIEQYRTGPFRPTAQVYESVAHDEADVVFGIDLRKWAGLGVTSPNGTTSEHKDLIHPVLKALFAALHEAYTKLPNDAERRKTWIYEVPLPAVHHLRETLNSIPPENPIPEDTLKKYDAPVLASAVKLWALELDPPLCMYEGWDEFRKLYPTMGAGNKEGAQSTEMQHVLDLQSALQKLPKVHLVVLDAIVKHLKDLIDNTDGGNETNEVYISKLALSLGRSVLRPKVETNISIQDRHPTLLFIDLLQKYDDILPPTLTRKKRESERKVPVRRRTRPVDMRMSRSRISAGMDLKELHAQQMAQRGIRSSKSPPPVPPMPPMPQLPVPETNVIPPTPAVAETPGSATSLTEEPGSIHEEPEDIALGDNRTPVATAAPLPSVPAPAPAVAPSPPPAAPAVPPPPPVATTAKTPPPPAAFANVPPPPPLPPTNNANTDVPPRFKSPPPETDDHLPPRPQFKEPPPELPEEGELPMPNFPATTNVPPSFVDPPPEPLTPPATSGSPPTSAGSPTFSSSSRTMSPPKAPSRKGSVSSRSGSPNKAQAEAAARVRQSRVGGPRVTGGNGSVGSMVKNLNNRSSISGPPRPASPASSANGRSSSSTRPTNTHAKRSSANRASFLERRTMASDAEDEIIQ
ncbi:hypothetical protein K474DRAFT_1666835 [Panus rudis PR-1116 ss-1]|nr:hypothetical protein K474DRAFT_1666835 [Panus rudis PR-1116 ss-1]